MLTTMRYAAFLVALFASSATEADEPMLHHGRCQALTVLDENASGKCADFMVVQAAESGERGFLFHMSDGAAVVFTTIDAPAGKDGTRVIPVARVTFSFRGQVEAIVVSRGACRTVDPKTTWRAETVCEAETVKGRFAATFVTIDGAAEPVQPDEVPGQKL